MGQEKRVKCPACEGVGYVRHNRVGDPFFTCTNCGAWNGRGPKFRAWCNSLPAIGEPEQGKQVKAEMKPDKTHSPAFTETKSDNWLEDI